MKAMKSEFIQGGIANGFSELEAVKVFELIERFANYGFNKSHSVVYGYIAYWLAYLKANFPLEFLVLYYQMNKVVMQVNLVVSKREKIWC